MSEKCIFICDVCIDGCILIAPEDDAGMPEKCPYNKDVKSKWRQIG